MIILKRKEKFEYLAFGIIPDRGIVGDGGLAQLNNRFFKLDTKTIVNIENVLPNNNDEGSKRIEGETNILLYGVPGSGKSWTIEHEYCKPSTNVERLVFHPDYTYADFIGQILPNVAENGQVSYKFTPGPFTTILKDAYQNPDKEYILIIEEINRGNAPAIFGEVFQLLDRIKEDNNNGEYPTGTTIAKTSLVVEKWILQYTNLKTLTFIIFFQEVITVLGLIAIGFFNQVTLL